MLRHTECHACNVYVYICVDDVDFVPVRHEVQLQADQLRVCVSVVILDDSIGERIEDFLVVVENVPSNDLVIEGLSVAPTISEICITDNDSKCYAKGQLNRRPKCPNFLEELNSIGK